MTPKYLSPFFIRNEPDLDAGIVSVQRSTFTFAQVRLYQLLNAVAGILNKFACERGSSSDTGGQSPASGGFSLDSAMALWKSFGPSLMGNLQSV